MFGQSGGRAQFLIDCPEGMDNDDQELVQVEFELPPDIYAARAARRRGMALEDFLSVVVLSYLKGTLPLWHKPDLTERAAHIIELRTSARR
jgi:hypothetical protein